jgi:F-type H+-transporting ATPase subunit epsilon
VSFTNEFEAEQKLFISSGFVEMQPHIVTVLADTVTRTKGLDEAGALAAMERAQNPIAAKLRRRIATNS